MKLKRKGKYLWAQFVKKWRNLQSNWKKNIRFALVFQNWEFLILGLKMNFDRIDMFKTCCRMILWLQFGRKLQRKLVIF